MINSMIALKKKIKDLEGKKHRAEGRMEQLLQTLKTVFDCDSLVSAKNLLKTKKMELKQIEKQYEREYSHFMEKWGNVLEDEENQSEI